MLLQLKNIHKDFKLDRTHSFKALNDISISFDKGEFVSILGPSGCGKSTLLNLIAGLDRPTSGSLIIDGRSTAHFKQNDWDLYRKNNIGFVFQQFNLVEHLTALENVEIVMTLIGLTRKKRRQRAMHLLKQVGIDKYASHLPSELSGGQKQRVAIARALANDPEIILADEPTGALDTQTGLQIMQLLKKIAGDKLIIMVTHNQQLAEDYSTRVVKMLDGKIQDVETVRSKNEQVNNTSLNKKNQSMPYLEALKLSLRNMRKKIGRVLITAIAGSIGIAGITLVMGLGNGANHYIAEQITHFGNANVLQVSKTIEREGEIVEVSDQAEYENLLNLDHVVMIRPNLDTTAMSIATNDEVLDTSINTLAPRAYQSFLTKITLGTIPVNDNEVIINRALARRIIEVDGLAKEDYQSVLDRSLQGQINLGMNFTNDFKIVGIVDEIDIDRPFIYLNYEDLENFYRSINIPMQGTYYDIITEKITTYQIIIDDPSHTVEVFHHINDPENGGIGLFSFGAGTKASSFSMFFYTAFHTVILIAQAVMVLFLIVALIVSSILIAIVLFSSILERRTEIGILKAIGARNKDIMRVFESEAFLLGLFAGIIGIGLAFALVPIIELIAARVFHFNITGIIQIPWIANLPGTKIPIPGLYLIGLVLISVIVALIAGYLPSKKATKMQVIDALRDE